MLTNPHAEQDIWLPIAEHPEHLGFSGASSLHHIQLGDQSGYLDLALFPPDGPKIVLVEAKRAVDTRSGADVVGQLVKYYTHTLALGAGGLDALRSGARRWGGAARPSRLLSFKTLFGVRTQAEATARAGAGEPLRAEDVALVIALDALAPKLEHRLFRAVEALDRYHGLSIGIAIVDGSRPRWHREWTPSRSVPPSC